MIKENEWIHWPGGDMPVPEGTRIDVRHRDGQVFLNQPAGSLRCETWAHSHPWHPGDIVDWRLTKQAE